MLMRCLGDLIRHVVIKCNVRVIEGRVNEVIEVRSGQVIECMLLLLLLLLLLLHESRDFTRSRSKALSACCCCLCVFWSSKGNRGAGPGGMGLTPLHTYCHCQYANEVSNSDILILNMSFLIYCFDVIILNVAI